MNIPSFSAHLLHATTGVAGAGVYSKVDVRVLMLWACVSWLNQQNRRHHREVVAVIARVVVAAALHRQASGWLLFPSKRREDGCVAVGECMCIWLEFPKKASPPP